MRISHDIQKSKQNIQNYGQNGTPKGSRLTRRPRKRGRFGCCGMPIFKFVRIIIEKKLKQYRDRFDEAISNI